jgi:hypothetical protein
MKCNFKYNSIEFSVVCEDYTEAWKQVNKTIVDIENVVLVEVIL